MPHHLSRLEQQLLGDEIGAAVPGGHKQNAALSSGGPATPLRAGRVAAAATELAEPELSPLFPIFQTKGTAGACRRGHSWSQVLSLIGAGWRGVGLITDCDTAWWLSVRRR
eukprot:COSAG01_NODE_7036_length_3382_cov_3.027719_3_plen_111_part_00